VTVTGHILGFYMVVAVIVTGHLFGCLRYVKCR
jgi:hypothetical protein